MACPGTNDRTTAIAPMKVRLRTKLRFRKCISASLSISSICTNRRRGGKPGNLYETARLQPLPRTRKTPRSARGPPCGSPPARLPTTSPSACKTGESFELAEMKRVSQWARDRKIGLHLDGASGAILAIGRAQRPFHCSSQRNLGSRHPPRNSRPAVTLVSVPGETDPI